MLTDSVKNARASIYLSLCYNIIQCMMLRRKELKFNSLSLLSPVASAREMRVNVKVLYALGSQMLKTRLEERGELFV